VRRISSNRDLSEKAIIEYLRKAGWSVLPISVRNGPDLVIGRQTKTAGGINLLVEVKTGNRKLRAGQQKWAEAWLGHPPYVLRDVADAEKLTRVASKL
jgi:hypothetical protein